MREQTNFDAIVNYADNTITILEYTFYDNNGKPFCGSVGHYIDIYKKDENLSWFDSDRDTPKLKYVDIITAFLKDKIDYEYVLVHSGGGRIFTEEFNGNINPILNNEIFIAEVSGKL